LYAFSTLGQGNDFYVNLTQQKIDGIVAPFFPDKVKADSSVVLPPNVEVQLRRLVSSVASAYNNSKKKFVIILIMPPISQKV
jgi:hypothetical protein